MKNILRCLSWQKIVFFIVLGIVIFQNRISGIQYLSGWDNLQPEINFGLELSRQLSAVWQEFRGLGHLGGMGHAADMPRTLILWVFSWGVPSNFLRWGWHVGMLVLGPIGIWYMGRRLWRWSESAAVTASMFYLLNLATVQYFYTPYEAFSAFYGFLPWLISSLVMFLENGKRKDVIRLLIVSLLATTAFYVQTLFVVYVMLLFIISLGYLKHWRRVLTAGVIVFVANAFWLLPVIYFVISNAGVVGVSKINSIASPETAYMNEAMGGWRDVLSIKGFWLEYVEWRGNEWGRLLQAWYEWINGNIVQILSLSLAGLSIIGMVIGAIKKRIGWWVGAFFILTFIMLASNNPPIGFAYTYLTGKIPFFGEMFRSVFTKWSVVMGLVAALGLGVMVELALTKKWLATILTVVIVSMAGFIVWPFFGGNLIFQSMKVEYPSEFGQLYKFFGEQDKSGKIVYLPSAWAWGWQYHDWGYRGSGFLWYGIEQPILDRAFDVWSPYNETFYNEFSSALYGCESGKSQITYSPILKSGCGEQVASVLQKYDVRYVLLDESVIAPGQGKEILRIEETKKIAQELGWEEKFQDNFLTVWEVKSQSSDHSLSQGSELGISAPNSYTFVNADTSKVRRDVIYEQLGTYIEYPPRSDLVGVNPTRSDLGGRELAQVTYPFAGLMREEVEGVEYGEGKITISYEETPPAFGVPTRDSLESPVEESPLLVIPGWKLGDKVEVQFKAKLENQKLEINWESVYSVNGEMGPKLQSSDHSLSQGSELKSGVWVSVGGSHIYVKDQEVSGVAKLTVGEQVEIKIYDGKGVAEKITLPESQPCGDNGEFKCYAIPLKKTTAANLLQTITHFESVSGTRPEICLDLEGEPYQCANETKTGESPAIVLLDVNSGERYWLDYIDRAGSTLIKDPGVVWYIMVERKVLSEDIWTQFTDEQRFEIDEGKIQVTVAGEPNVYDFSKVGKVRPENCDVLKRGEAKKLVARLQSDTATHTTYLADGRGAICDYVNMDDLDTNLSYLMRIKGENGEGRSLKYSLYNTGSKRNDIEWLMKSTGNPVSQYPSENGFDSTFGLLPWDIPGSYSLNIETRSFGQYAENTIEPVELRWFPLEQIAGARIVPIRSDLHSRSDLKITEVKKTGTWLYRVKVQGSGLLKLSQGYDEGWIAPPIQHVKVDGWANGWLIENSGEVVIFYWPQLLEYLGFVLLGATIWRIILLR